MAKYDVYWAVICYADNPSEKKRRPVVQLKDDPDEKGAFVKITKTNRNADKYGGIRIRDIKSAGLYEPSSTIQLVNRISNKPSLEYAGRLSEYDIRQVELHESIDESKIEYRLAEEIDDDFDIQSILQEVESDKRIYK